MHTPARTAHPSRRRCLQRLAATALPLAAAPWLPGCAAPPAGAGAGAGSGAGAGAGAGASVGAAAPAVAGAAASGVPGTAFDAWAEAFAADWVRLSPERATFTQYFSGAEQAALERELSPRTPAQRERALALARRGLAELGGLQAREGAAWSPAQRTDAATLRWSLQGQIDGTPFDDHAFVFNQLRGPQVALPNFLAEAHPLRHEADLDSYLARLRQVPQRVDEALALAQRAAARGLLPPRFIAERARGQVTAFLALAPAETPFVSALARRSAALQRLPAATRTAALAEAQALAAGPVRAAWERIGAFLDALLPRTGDDAGLSRLPDGQAAYAQALAANTTTTLGAAEIHAIGLREVARLRAAIDTELRKLGRTEGTVEQRVAQLARELQPPAEPDPRPALIARYTAYVREAGQRARPLFNLVPQAPVEVRRVAALTERTASASYSTPAPDGSRPGVFWVPLPGPSFNVMGMKTLAVHEAVPGHHFQLALQQEERSLPRWRQRRVFGGGSAHSEGWALYAEQLAIEQGWYAGGDPSDAHQLIGALNAQLFRARRLVVDTGLHAMRWTRQQAIDYGIPASEVERYVVQPGQACAYMVGMLHLLALRAQAQRALGPRFSLPAFHDLVLRTGSVPLQVLSEVVAQWQADGGVARTG